MFVVCCLLLFCCLLLLLVVGRSCQIKLAAVRRCWMQSRRNTLPKGIPEFQSFDGLEKVLKSFQS